MTDPAGSGHAHEGRVVGAARDDSAKCAGPLQGPSAVATPTIRRRDGRRRMPEFRQVLRNTEVVREQIRGARRDDPDGDVGTGEGVEATLCQAVPSPRDDRVCACLNGVVQIPAEGRSSPAWRKRPRTCRAERPLPARGPEVWTPRVGAPHLGRDEQRNPRGRDQPAYCDRRDTGGVKRAALAS
jgi:hypothetical protein